MELTQIGQIKPNPTNPRTIRGDKFKKLVQSLKDFPEMAKVRPIVVNKEMIVLGGNMRLRAMKEAGWKECPVEIVDWTEEKQKEFLIKDNISYGEFDEEALANDWPFEQLEQWGLDILDMDNQDKPEKQRQITIKGKDCELLLDAIEDTLNDYDVVVTFK